MTVQKIDVSQIANTGGLAGQVLVSNGTSVTWGDANNTAFVGSVAAANVVSNAQLQSNLANYATSSLLTDYQTTAGMSTNVATLTANSTNFVGSVSAANVVSNAQLSANLSNYQTTAGLSANVSILTANNANNLGGVAAASYVNTSGAYTLSGNISFSSNLTIDATGELIIANGAGIYANGSLGNTGQVLTSNGSAVHWSTSAGGGGGGISSLSFVGFYSGYNNPTTGTLRRYFANNITITKMTAWVSVTSGSNLKLTLKKNGSEIANTTITAGANTSNVTFSSNVISDVDYLTLDLTSGSGTDIGVRIDYTPYA